CLGRRTVGSRRRAILRAQHGVSSRVRQPRAWAAKPHRPDRRSASGRAARWSPTLFRVASLILSRRDLDFLLHEWLAVESLTKRPRFAEHSRETFDAVLDLAERIATDHFAPHNRKADENEPRMVGGEGAQ